VSVAALADPMLAPDARVHYGPDPLQFGDLRLPAGPGPRPVVVTIHGGFWRAAHDLTYLNGLCAALTAAGAATWNIEYRRIGQPGGGWPGTFHDAARAVDHLRALAPEHNLDLGRVVTLGHSAGGHLALWLAARGRIPAGDAVATPDGAPLPLKGAVSLAGVCDLRQGWDLGLGDGAVEALMGGPPAAYPERYATASPAALLPLGVPQTLIHGTDDDRVPVVVSQDYYAHATASGDDASLITLPATGHFEFTVEGSEAWRAIFRTAAPLLEI